MRLLISSAYAGGRQPANPNLAFKIHELVSRNEDVLDLDAGYQVKITRAYSAGSRFPETELSVNQTSTSLNELLGQLPSEDLAQVCPITESIRQIEPKMQWALLANVTGPELAHKIRTDTATI